LRFFSAFPLFPALTALLFFGMPGLVCPQSASGRGGGAAAFYERGRDFMAEEDWYSAAESLLECVRINPAHTEGTAALAECYYELGEFDEALLWVRKARALARGSLSLANLEAFVLIALGQLERAGAVISDVLAREPYNKEALFAAAELDIALGRAGDALKRYREVVRRYPDDRRVLVSLALALGSLGDEEGARSFIERALAEHPDDYRVYYYAAYLDAQAGRFAAAIGHTERALFFRPGYPPARSLLASLRYRSGQYEEAARLADEAIALNRDDTAAWYLKGMAFTRLGRYADAMAVLSVAAAIDPGDEFVRAVLEELLIAHTALEDPGRVRWAAWHFNRARAFRTRNLTDQALFEYRRGLRLNPYARDRREYADLLLLQGYPSRQLEELRFIQGLNMENQFAGPAEWNAFKRSVDDAVEAYDALLSDALHRRWSVDPVETAARHWKVAVFSVASQSAFYHPDAGSVGSSYIRELLVHDRNVAVMNLEPRQTSFSQAFRAAREEGADYFLLIGISEGKSDLAIKAELFVARTGSPAAVFYAFRTGADRLRNAARGITEQLSAALPFRGEILDRRASQALIDKGRSDGAAPGRVYEVVKRGQAVVRNEGIGLVYSPGDVAGTFIIENAGEELSSGILSRNGFFDRIAPGDEIIAQDPPPGETPEGAPEPAADPELRTLLRTLR
jgi:tetratricopeptide (TPR) repeat protein